MSDPCQYGECIILSKMLMNSGERLPSPVILLRRHTCLQLTCKTLNNLERNVCVCTYTHVNLALDSGLVQRGVVPIVSGVGVGSMPKQQIHHLHKNTVRLSEGKLCSARGGGWCGGAVFYVSVAEGAGVVERYQPSVISGVDIGAVAEEKVHNVFTTEA